MYEQETKGIFIRVEPCFLEQESEPDEGRFVWAYTIEIENRSPETVQLINRHWRLTDAKGVTQDVRGAGVVGKQPVLKPGQTFRYTSAAPLGAPSGVMVGSFEMIDLADGAHFEVDVPAFALDSPFGAVRPN